MTRAPHSNNDKRENTAPEKNVLEFWNFETAAVIMTTVPAIEKGRGNTFPCKLSTIYPPPPPPPPPPPLLFVTQ